MNVDIQHSDRTARDVAALLHEADVSTLLMVVVLYTKDEALLDELRPYILGPWDWMEKIPEDLKKKVRTRALRLIEEIKSGVRGEPSAPSAAFLQKMMSVCVGQPVPDEYVPMVLDHLHLSDNLKPQEPQWTKSRSKGTNRDFNVVVVGAGMSGICASIKLAEAGIDHVVLEKNDAVGGTWYENAYPGAGVDTPNHVYSYSFEPNHDWPEYFSKRDELFNYFSSVARKYRVTERTRFKTEVVSARFDDATALWHLSVKTGVSGLEQMTANVVIFAVGLLNRPSVPDIAGLSEFEGPILHTARWNAEIDLTGRRVAVIGTGASGMQVAPTIAPDVERLLIFQRSPHWVASNPNYHRAVSEGKKWALKNVPYYAAWYRFQLWWASADSIHASLKVDPEWPALDRSLNAANDQMRSTLTDAIRAEIGDDAELLEKVIPKYPPYGKRMLRDNHWFSMLKRDNVELVTEPIEKVDRSSISTANGRSYPVDAIVMATGFSVGHVLGPVRVSGAGGISLRELWGEDDPRAFLGITVPGFPNMFILYGPNTNLAHGGSAMFHTECQVAYVLQAIRKLLDEDLAALDCKQVVHDQYNAKVDEAHAGMVWAHQGVNSWYKNRAGRVFATSPWRLVDYWQLTHIFNPDDFSWIAMPQRD